jgi:hypothetical protein
MLSSDLEHITVDTMVPTSPGSKCIALSPLENPNTLAPTLDVTPPVLGENPEQPRLDRLAPCTLINAIAPDAMKH